MSRNKLISIVCTLALLVGFFCVPNKVHAENTYVRQLRNYSNSISSVSLTYSATAAQFDYVTESTLSGGMYSPVLITVRFTNNGSNDIKIANSYVDLTFTTYSEVSGYDCYTSDLMVQMVKNGNDTPRYNIVASNGYSYGGHIVVPALSSLYLVFEVDIAAHYDTSSGQVVSPSLDAVLVSVNASDVVAGDYPTTGSIPEQLDQLETYVAQLAGYTYGNGQSLATITSLLIDIKNQIQFTGTFTLPNTEGFVYRTNIWQDNLNNFNMRLYIKKMGSFVFNDEFEIVNSNTSYHTGDIVIPINYVVRVINSDSHAVSVDNAFLVLPTDFLPVGSGISYVIGEYSIPDAFRAPYVTYANPDLSLRVPLKYSYGNLNNAIGYFPSGYYLLSVTLYCIVPFGTSITLPQNNDIQLFNYTFSTSEFDYEMNSDNYVYDIRNYLIGNSSANQDTGDAADDAGALSDQIHQQEETWYDENSAAMEAVGLSSYRFTNQQASGILGVTTQFEQLWLSLGNWTLVYIFVLMASLATFILRHEPSTRVKQMRDMYMTDRAVARDWEMRTNPEKFSHRRWVENNRRH